MSPERKDALKVTLRRWLASVVIVVGFLYYHSAAPLGPVLFGVLGSFVTFVGYALYQTRGSNGPDSQ